MKRVAHTTFSPEGYSLYGANFIDTFIQHWPIPLVVFYQGVKPHETEGVTYINLREDEEYLEFLDQYGDDPVANGLRGGKIDYRFQAVKFCHKVFAQTSPQRPECDQWIWIDADVETTRDVDPDWLGRACRPGVVASYLGRQDWHHSECGFMAYNVPMADVFLKELRRTYTSGEIFSLAEWHDSFVWDTVRGAMCAPFYNLSENIRGTHPWPHTVLGECLVHEKGPVAKVKRYGATI